MRLAREDIIIITCSVLCMLFIRGERIRFFVQDVIFRVLGPRCK